MAERKRLVIRRGAAKPPSGPTVGNTPTIKCKACGVYDVNAEKCGYCGRER